MGMVLIGRRLSAEELAALRADPTALDALLYGDLDDDEAEMPEPELDLDKAWHGIQLPALAAHRRFRPATLANRRTGLCYRVGRRLVNGKNPLRVG